MLCLEPISNESMPVARTPQSQLPCIKQPTAYQSRFDFISGEEREYEVCSVVKVKVGHRGCTKGSERYFAEEKRMEHFRVKDENTDVI